MYNRKKNKLRREYPKPVPPISTNSMFYPNPLKTPIPYRFISPGPQDQFSFFSFIHFKRELHRIIIFNGLLVISLEEREITKIECMENRKEIYIKKKKRK